MSRRRKTNSRRPAPAADRVHDVLVPIDELVIASAGRSGCSDCGSDRLAWGDVVSGALGARSEAQRRAFAELYRATAGRGGGGAAWWCLDCDGLGAFLDVA